MAEGHGHQRWEAIGVGSYVCMDVEGPHDDVKNWERRKILGVNEWREVFNGSNVVTKGEAYTRVVIGEERNE